MEEQYDVPEEIKIRVPLFKKEWMQMINKLRSHSHAPVWNTKCGDRLFKDDIPFIKEFEESLDSSDYEDAKVSVVKWIKKNYSRSAWFYEKLSEAGITGLSEHDEIINSFKRIPLMKRDDLQQGLVKIVPYEEDLSRLIINPTSGTTGQPVLCPNHPRAIGCYDPFVKFMLGRHGVKEELNYHKVAAIQLCAQVSTITYNTVHSYFEGAGFAKINLYESEWKEKDSPEIYINDMEPIFLSGDPYSFHYYMKKGISYRPKAILTTAVTLEKSMYKQLKDYFNCPVINLYSLNDTGPLAYSCPLNPDEFHILPKDIIVETDETGEIIVTGGRNPFIPLLRYCTGDRGIIDYSECACGDPMPRIKNLSARKLVVFKTKKGKPVNQIDISRAISKQPVFGFQFRQRKDYSCELRIAYLYGTGASTDNQIISDLKELFGGNMEIELIRDGGPANEKKLPFISELE